MSACTKRWYKYTSCVERALSKGFRKWGIFVSAHPLLTIILSAVLAAILSIFTLNIQDETEIAELFAPKGTASYENYVKYQDTWEKYQDDVGYLSVIIFDNTDESKNILNTNSLLFFHQLYDNVTSIQVSHENTSYKYHDICYRYENGNCQTSSILELYQYNASNIASTFNSTLIIYPVTYSPWSYKNAFIPSLLGQNISTQIIEISTNDNNANTPSPVNSSSNQIQTTQFFSTSTSTTTSVPEAMNGVDSVYVPVVTGSPAFQMIFQLDIGRYGTEICDLFHEEFINIMREYATDTEKNDQFAISYEGFNSFNDELTRAVASDVTSFVLAFVLLSLFSTLMVMRFKRREEASKCCICDNSRCRARIGWIGTVSAMLAVGSSFGIVGGLMGVKFNSVVSVAPFLLVGLGLDDMFVLLRAYELTSPLLPISERIALTMERGGISIMFTSITDLTAFCVGSTSAFGSISAFCIYCGVGVFMDFVFQISFFLGFMVYDSRWQETPSCAECCCGKIKNLQPTMEKAVELETRKTGTETQAMSTTTAHKSTHSKNNNSSFKLNMIEPEASSVVMEKLGSFLLGSWWVKLIVILLFVGYLIGAAVGIASLDAYQDPIDLAPKDSYLVAVYEANERYFNAFGPPLQFILDKPLDYSEAETFDRIQNFVVDIRNDECFENTADFTVSWIHNYREYLDENYLVDRTVNQSMFYDILYNEFLISEQGENHIQDIWSTIVTQQVGYSVLETNNETEIFGEDVIGSAAYERIQRSRIWMTLKPTGRSTEEIKHCLDNFVRLQDAYRDSLGAYYYSYFTLFAESDLITVQQTVNNLVYACLAACIITIVLIPYPLMALIVMWTVAQILFGVLGYMSLWGLPINTTTMINVVISVGFSVDNAAHFAHAFMHAPMHTDGIVIYIDKKNTKLYGKENERYARVLYALNAVGMPILAGDLSTIVALLPLAGAESEIFISFWKCILLVMLFGAVHAILFLPVLLSVIGPLGYNNVIQNDSSLDPVQPEQEHSPSDRLKRDSLENETYLADE